LQILAHVNEVIITNWVVQSFDSDTISCNSLIAPMNFDLIFC